MGHYIYAIAATPEEETLTCSGMPDSGPVSLICHKGIAAVVSSTPVLSYPISRKNTMAHQQVMEQVMKHHTILPVKFGTVADTLELIYEKLLEERHKELEKQLNHFAGKVELGLKLMWREMDSVYSSIIQESPKIRAARDRLNRRRGGRQDEQIHLGEMVAAALEQKKKKEEALVWKALKGLWVDHRINNAIGDAMILHHAYLVDQNREAAFDEAIDQLLANRESEMKLKYVGPTAPSHFIELHIQW